MKTTTVSILCSALLAALGLPACGDVADGLSASSIESALCRDARCDDSAPSGSAGAHGDDATPDAGGADTCWYDSDCGAGFECETEHGSSYCKPHGHHTSSAEPYAPGADAGAEPPAPPGAGCYYDSECARGERCESIGGGQRACAPHADHGDDDRGYDDHGDDDRGYDDRSGSNSGRH